MNLLRGLATIPLVALLLANLALPHAHAVTIDWVTVGNPRNANDTINTGTNPNLVYNSLMGSDARGGITNTGTTNGSRYAAKPNIGDKPVNYVSWWDAARVSNWLHNGPRPTAARTHRTHSLYWRKDEHEKSEHHRDSGNLVSVSCGTVSGGRKEPACHQS